MKKTSKRFVIIVTIAVIMVITLLIAVFNGFLTRYDDTLNGEFSINEEHYQKIINIGERSVETLKSTFSELSKLKEYVGPIPDAAVAREKAEEVWIDAFGWKNIIKDERPYQVYYDSENAVWLVRGTLPEGYLGGNAHILFKKDDGKIIAVWHER